MAIKNSFLQEVLKRAEDPEASRLRYRRLRNVNNDLENGELSYSIDNENSKEKGIVMPEIDNVKAILRHIFRRYQALSEKLAIVIDI